MNTTTTEAAAAAQARDTAQDTARDRAAARPAIAVIIPHYNDPVRLARCLAALVQQDLEGAEVLVVDNGSPAPPDAQMQARFPAVRFVSEAEQGAGPARNRGVRASSAPVLAFLDADCVPAPGWLAAARAAAPRAGLTGGRVEVFDETPPPRSGAEAFETVFAFDFRRYIEVKGFSGAGNLVTTRQVFEDVGPFRTGLSEDNDWSFRATARGHRLAYDPAMCAGHPSRAGWAELRRKWLRLTQEHFALRMAGRSTAGARAAGRLGWALKALAMPASALAHLPRVLFSPRLAGAGERLRGAATLVRLRLQRMAWMLRQAAGGRV